MFPSQKFFDKMDPLFEKLEPYALPMGGIREDAPPEIKEIYKESKKLFEEACGYDEFNCSEKPAKP